MPNLIFNFSRFIGLKIIHFDSERNKPRIVRPKIMTKLYFRAVIWTIVLLYLRCYSLHWLPWLLHEYTAILKYALLSTRGRCGTAGGIARDSHSCGERAHLLQRAAVEAAHVCCTHLCAPRHGTWMENFWGLLSIESTFKGLVRSGTSTGTDVKKSGSPQVRLMTRSWGSSCCSSSSRMRLVHHILISHHFLICCDFSCTFKLCRISHDVILSF